MANTLIKPIKSALVKKYGYKNVTVRNGSGTAWGSGFVDWRETLPQWYIRGQA